MNWEAIGAVGEVGGAVAVVVTLVYLAVQVRHASAVAKANAYRNIHQDIGQLFGDVMSDPELYRIWRSGLVKGEPLTDEDQEKLGMILIRMFGSFDSGLHSGWLDPRLDAFVKKTLNAFLELPAVQRWWSRQGHLQPEPFRSIVDATLREIGDRSENEVRATLQGDEH